MASAFGNLEVSFMRRAAEQYARTGGQIDGAEADRLLGLEALLERYFGETEELNAFMQSIPTTYKLDAEATRKLGGSQPPPPPANTPVQLTVGRSASSLDDDKIKFGPDGKMSGKSGTEGYVRSYDAVKQGPLRFRHGSQAPASVAMTDAELADMRKRPPGESLDIVAGLLGARLTDFSQLAESKQFYNTDAQGWEGKCHAWCWSAMSNQISKLVDVEGTSGARGLWIMGEWISRADLGNWLMGLGDSISVQDGNTLFDSSITALDLLKGVMMFMMNDGGGVIGDICLDSAHGGTREVWNQPFLGADLVTSTIEGAGAAAILEQAKADGVQGGVAVKLVKIEADYGVEVSDDHEGDMATSTQNWNLYAVCDAEGNALTAYMANDKKIEPKISSISGMETYSEEVLEYFWKPDMSAMDAAIKGTVDVDTQFAHLSNEFRFYVKNVLGNGVPGHVRAAFEAKVKALPAGAINADTVAALKTEFPKIANAYSPDQWKTHFASRGLNAREFGALVTA